METLKRRILKIEAKTQPKKSPIDLVKVVGDIRKEQDRMMALSAEEYEAEMTQPAHSRENQTARLQVEYQKRFDAMPLEEQRRLKGYINIPLDKILELEEADRIRLTSPDNWVTNMM